MQSAFVEVTLLAQVTSFIKRSGVSAIELSISENKNKRSVGVPWLIKPVENIISS